VHQKEWYTKEIARLTKIIAELQSEDSDLQNKQVADLEAERKDLINQLTHITGFEEEQRNRRYK
jgi:hypothetical protein